ncbi:PREDICTED: cytosolic phospholipase A2 epsilon-like [Gekko japonicus]|uniref:Phospholipase A2 n=1 Tax=Gekko japonicus TaxID=146911 RepID=A0ABM1JRL0_GEKJA|nr:PREDICTED: cytosolic phospholipase A2 epsilon-like [Gekko japonicus]
MSPAAPSHALTCWPSNGHGGGGCMAGAQLECLLATSLSINHTNLLASPVATAIKVGGVRDFQTAAIVSRAVARRIEVQVPTFYLLTVRVIRVRNLQNADVLSPSDCYVTLRLPTACMDDARTKTFSNSSNPVWNETFFFRLQSIVKNILELKVCDDDSPFNDDQLCTVLFDTSYLQPGKTLCYSFALNGKTDERLEVEFTMECMQNTVERLATNGVLVSRELCCLKVEVCGRRRRKTRQKRYFTFKVKGSGEDTQDIVLHSRSPVSTVFHYTKYCHPQMEILLPKNSISSCCSSNKGIKDSMTVPLNRLTTGERVRIAHDKAYDIFVTPENCQKDLDVRLGYDLCAEEQDFICKRKRYVAAALKKLLHLKEDLYDDEVPIVAAMTTAGGVRSMTAMYGSVRALQKLNVLDCISYITGLSGTTWTMVNLYDDPEWSSKDIDGHICEIRQHVVKSKLCCFSGKNLKYYGKEMCQRQQEGHKITFSDLWGLFIETMLRDKPNPHKLSSQRQAVNWGQNPLPIYLALNVKESYSTLDFKEWVEFTPYEVGFPKYGAFVRAEDFGSEFFMGHLIKKIPESRLCYLEGTWSNIFSQNMLDALYLSENSEDFWHTWTRDRVIDIDENTYPTLPKRPNVQRTRLFIPSGSLSKVLRDVVTMRPVVSHYHNFMKGLQMNNKYLENHCFSTWKDTVLDSSPNRLTETPDYLELVDTAFFINTSCPPLLRPERKVDLILHLNYSGGSQTLPLDLSMKYYAEQGIPYPKTVLSEEDRQHLKECYLFDEADNPKAPIVLYFPLVCDTFQKYKAPGVERSPDEMEEGEADVTSTIFSPYATGLVQYTEEDFNKLLNLTNYNILNNEHMVLQALRIAVERKKRQKRESLF